VSGALAVKISKPDSMGLKTIWRMPMVSRPSGTTTPSTSSVHTARGAQ
jgi:hypothetical protein